MPLVINRRVGPAGTARTIDGLLEKTEAVIPPTIVGARSRWQNLELAEPVVAPTIDTAMSEAVDVLYRSVPVKPNGVVRAKSTVLVDPTGVEAARLADDRADLAHVVWARALQRATAAFVRAVDESEDQLVTSCQRRAEVVYAELYRAVAGIPIAFTAESLPFAASEIRDAWVAASQAWSEIEVLRSLLDAFTDPRREQATSYSAQLRYTRTKAVEDKRITSTGLAFAVELCRAITGPGELWMPTAAQGSELADRLWPPVGIGARQQGVLAHNEL